MTQWDFQNKGILTSPARLSFVFKVPLHHLRPSVIYSVPCDQILQRAYYQIFDGSSSATRRHRKKQLWSHFHYQKSLRKSSLSKRCFSKTLTYEMRLFLKESKILNDLSAHHIVRMKEFCANPLAMISAGVNLGLFGINDHRLSSLRDFLELDLSQPTSNMLLDSHVYTQK